MSLTELLRLAEQHTDCLTERPRIEGDAVVIPFDVKLATGGWDVAHERVRTRAELLEALGY